MNNMSLSAALTEGLLVTGVGMIIVFSVLVILMIVMIGMKKIFYKEQKSHEKGNSAKSSVKVGNGITIKSKSGKDLSDDPNLPVLIAAAVAASDDTQLVAVLAAAVASYTDVSPCNLRIKSYRRLNDNMPAWRRAGLKETIDSKL